MKTMADTPSTADHIKKQRRKASLGVPASIDPIISIPSSA
jgi:hypothetical protein